MKLVAIADNTFREGVRQPFYVLVGLLVAALLVSHYFLPFFTLGEDIKMFEDITLSYILMGLLVTALLLASKVVDEEIENKTTLTLMSKPVRRWELIVGKFVGVMYAVTLMLVVLGALLTLLTWLRAPEELRGFGADQLDEDLVDKVGRLRQMHVLALLPAFVLVWMQIAVMAAISVAISTRLGMVLNVVIGVALFVVSHLVAFLATASGPLARTLTVLLPNLEQFNMNPLLIYRDVVFGAASAGSQVAYAEVWKLVGLASAYGAAWVVAALLLGLALFRTRELG